MCHGMVLAHPELALNAEDAIIYRQRRERDKVTLISGGGSGHEPAHAGFVGQGMLDAAVCGDVFASPSQMQVYQAITSCAGERGVLLVIKNYSGDMMNFMNAARLAAEDGIAVATVRVDDDIAVKDSLYTVGRRGVAGTVFVHKIAGAAASMGKNLEEVAAVARKTVSRVRSIGLALSSCTVPAKGSPTFSLAETEIEYGVGIHGEPGIRRESIQKADILVHRMVTAIRAELELSAASRVAVLVNGFGATPLMELYLAHNAVVRELSRQSVRIARSFVGNFMTSLDMAGFSLSILLLDQELEALLDHPCATPALSVTGPAEATRQEFYAGEAAQSLQDTRVTAPEEFAVIRGALRLENMLYLVEVMSVSILRNEILFCELDAHAGDGDFGQSLARGFGELQRRWQEIVSRPGLTIGGFLDACSQVLMKFCGGASGPIWGAAFRAAGKEAGEKTSLTPEEFVSVLRAAAKGIQSEGERSFGRGAVVGDKTLMDALIPCVEAWEKTVGVEKRDFPAGFLAGAEAAVAGAKRTENIVARMGRAGTAGERSLGYPDAGAHALGVIFTDIAKAVR